jgi:hypothetical protein
MEAMGLILLCIVLTTRTSYQCHVSLLGRIPTKSPLSNIGNVLTVCSIVEEDHLLDVSPR